VSRSGASGDQHIVCVAELFSFLIRNPNRVGSGKGRSANQYINFVATKLTLKHPNLIGRDFLDSLRQV
jgi:hypothetical protein